MWNLESLKRGFQDLLEVEAVWEVSWLIHLRIGNVVLENVASLKTRFVYLRAG